MREADICNEQDVGSFGKTLNGMSLYLCVIRLVVTSGSLAQRPKRLISLSSD